MGIERWATSTTMPAVPPGCDLGALLRDHRLDPTGPQILSIGSGPISTVSQNRVRTSSCTARTDSGNSNISQHFGQYHPVVALPAGDHDRQRSAPTVNGVMNLRRQSATRPSDSMPGRLSLRIGQILVIRCSPLCPDQDGTCSWHAGGHD